jgi:hypothetical protein
MRIVRLAQLFELKYGFQSEAAHTPVSEDRIFAEAKRDVLEGYRQYFSRSAKDSMLQYAADKGDPAAIAVTYKIDQMVKDIDKTTPEKLINSLNDIIGLMYKMKSDPTKATRQTIRDSLVGHKESVVKHYLTKYERIMSAAFPLLQKIAVRLQVLTPDVAIHGGNVSRQRGDLTKQELVNFVLYSSPFKTYGLDSLDVIEKFLEDPELKEKLTTLVNSVKKGNVPLEGFQVHTLAQQIKKKLDEKGKTNLPALESPELPASPQPEEGEE